mmetsp:Transcript_29342/g.60143  ORF Transcript_29342/g.60143 Transcript_29342/m.60143 type:complete len:141 (+) Transcript_29342:325-747(+)
MKQGIGFTLRKDGKAKEGRKSGKTLSGLGSGRSAENTGTLGASAEESGGKELWPRWAEQAGVLLETIHEAGGKPTDLAKGWVWKMIKHSAPEVQALAVKHLSWVDELGVWDSRANGVSSSRRCKRWWRSGVVLLRGWRVR